MAATISQRITLEGADDIQKALQALGDAGAKAFKQIQDAAAQPITNQAAIDKTRQALDQLSQAVAKLSPQFKQLAADTQAFGAAGNTATQQVTAGLNQTTAASQSAGAGLEAAAIKFGIAAVGVAVAVSAMVRSLTSGAGATAQTITDQANKLTISVPQWLKLQAAIDAAGGSSEQFVSATAPLIANLNKLNLEASGQQFFSFANGAKVVVQTMTTATPATAAMTAELQKFGVSLKAIQTGDTVAILQQLAATIAKMPAGAAQAAAGVKFFGDNWKQVVSDLTLASAAVKDSTTAMDLQVAKARQLSEAQIKASVDAKKAWEDLGSAIKSIKDLIGAVFAPSSGARAKWLTDMVDDARNLLTTFLQLNEAGRADFLANLKDSAGSTVFKVLVAVGQQLAGLWNDVLVPAAGKLMGVLDGMAALFEGITGSQVAAFFITMGIAVAGLAVALGTLQLLLTPIMALFSPFGAILLAAGAAAVVFWDQITAGAKAAAALIPAELAQISQSFTKLFAGDFVGFWNDFSNAAVTAFNKIAQGPDTGWVSTLVKFLAQIPDVIKVVAASIGLLIKAADAVAVPINLIFGTHLTGTGVILVGIILQLAHGLGLLEGVIIVVAAAVGVLANAFKLINAAWANPVAAAILVLIGLIAYFAIALVKLDWAKMGQEAQAAWDWVKAGAEAVKKFIEDWVTTPVGNAWQWIKDEFWGAVSILQSYMDAVTGWITAWVTTPIGNAWQWIKDTFWAVVQSLSGGGGAATSGIPPGDTGGGGFASGGIIGGRGTGTSDSNLAWVSRGEYITPAAAVAQPGVLAFLEALRRSGGDLSRVLDGLGRFALGGLVTMPAFASGGLGGMSHVTIQFPGLPAISGLRASGDVVAELQRSAAMAQVRSGGRKPSRYT